MTPFSLEDFRRLAEKRTFVLEDDAEFLDYCGNHADAIIERIESLEDECKKHHNNFILIYNKNIDLKERIEKLEAVVDALKTWCKDDPRDSYSEKLHEALEVLESEVRIGARNHKT